MEWRKLAPDEQKILDKMLEGDFPGRDAVTEQIRDALVRQIDSEGSLEFKVQSDKRVETKFRVPVEAWCGDSDGRTIYLSLHVVNGRVSELELYKDDSSLICEKPIAEKLEIFIPR
jgi:Domain of unknown function (DUF6984)